MPGYISAQCLISTGRKYGFWHLLWHVCGSKCKCVSDGSATPQQEYSLNAKKIYLSKELWPRWIACFDPYMYVCMYVMYVCHVYV